MKKGCLIALAIVLFLLLPVGVTVYRATQTDEVQDALGELEDVEIITEEYHQTREVTIEYADGTVHREEYLFSQELKDYLRNPIGCIYYENDQQVGQADFERDQFGNLLSVTTADSQTTYDLTYDDQNRITQQITSVDGVQTEVLENRYSPEGLLVETIKTQDGAALSRTTIEYNDLGRRTKIIHYDAADQITQYETCVFDEKDYHETVHQYDAAGNLLGYQENSYNYDLLIVTEEAYNASGEWISTIYRNITTAALEYTEGNRPPL